jgi:hypothetical protein
MLLTPFLPRNSPEHKIKKLSEEKAPGAFFA